MIIEKYTEIKSNISLFIEIFIAAFFLGFFLSYTIFPQEKNKDEICKNEIAQIKLLTMQLDALRQEYAKEKIKILKECTLNERNECLIKIDKYKAVCEQLRCEICNQRGN